jgi:myosin-5
VPDTLQCILQAVNLLQARKLEENVQSVCDTCDKLSMYQIIKILKLYTPADELKGHVSVSFIQRIQAIQERSEPQTGYTTHGNKIQVPCWIPVQSINYSTVRH